METFRTIWKFSGKFGNYPDSLETFRTVWKLSGQSGNFPDSLETFRTVKNLSGQSINCPDSLETANCLRNIGKVWLLFGKSGYYLESLVTVWQSGKSLDNMETVRTVGNYPESLET